MELQKNFEQLDSILDKLNVLLYGTDGSLSAVLDFVQTLPFSELDTDTILGVLFFLKRLPEQQKVLKKDVSRYSQIIEDLQKEVKTRPLTTWARTLVDVYL